MSWRVSLLPGGLRLVLGRDVTELVERYRRLAHGLNNDLAAILLLSDVVGRRLEPEHPAQEELASILETCHRAQRRAGELLASSLAAAQPGTETEPPPRPPAPERARGTLLLVDDQEHFRKMVARGLRMDGWTVLEAASGEEALEVFRPSSTELVAAVVDLVLPGISGVELFVELRKVRPELPVLLFSGFSRRELVKEALRLGVSAFLPKPIEFTDLTEWLHDLVIEA